MAIQKGASKLREHITPEDKPTHVSPTVTKGLHVAKQATGGAVKVSQFLGDSLSTFYWCGTGIVSCNLLMLCGISGRGVCGGQPRGQGVGATCEKTWR